LLDRDKDQTDFLRDSNSKKQVPVGWYLLNKSIIPFSLNKTWEDDAYIALELLGNGAMIPTI
jgi:hypothetical protein